MSNVKDSWKSLISELQRVCEIGFEKPDYYLAVRTVFDQIQLLTLYDDNPLEEKVDLVHYTSWNNALKMFKGLRSTDKVEDQMGNGSIPILRMYNYEQSNDPDEGGIKPPELEKIEEKIINFAKPLSSDKFDNLWIEGMTSGTGTYGCSFSSGPLGIEDDLTYWRLYGNNGNGCSLKISPTYNKHIYKVRYRERNESGKEEDKKVAERLKELLDVCERAAVSAPKEYKGFVRRNATELLFRIIYSYYHLIKHIAYEGEKEWRMISVMPRPRAIRFDMTSENIVKRYVEGATLEEVLSSGSAITIGPAVPNHGAARAFIEYLAHQVHNIKYVTVKNSKQTYRQAF